MNDSEEQYPVINKLGQKGRKKPGARKMEPGVQNMSDGKGGEHLGG